MANSKSIGIAYEDQNINGASTVLSDEYLGYTTAALRNITAGSLSEAVVLNFALIHCA